MDGNIAHLLDAPMMTPDRLILRPWKDEDFPSSTQMNADPRVREFFPSALTPEQSDAEIHYFRGTLNRDGFCLFAAEAAAIGELAGFIGLQTMYLVVPSLPQSAVEVGWRLSHTHWRKGLATEGARAVVQYAFTTLRLREVVAIPVHANLRSRRVMAKIAMKRLPEPDFDHPRIPQGHPLRAQVLYALKKETACSVANRSVRQSVLDRSR
jgi:RimJ/RimL family protein N-acetyltransferase